MTQLFADDHLCSDISDGLAKYYLIPSELKFILKSKQKVQINSRASYGRSFALIKLYLFVFLLAVFCKYFEDFTIKIFIY